MSVYEIKKPKKINSFSITLFLIIVVGGYLAYWYIPIWWPVFQMKGIMSGICNDAYREMNDEKLMTKMLKEAQRTHLAISKENFKIERVAYLPAELPSEEARRELMQRRGKACRITFNYHKSYELPWLGKQVPLSWTKQVESDLGIIKY